VVAAQCEVRFTLTGMGSGELPQDLPRELLGTR